MCLIAAPFCFLKKGLKCLSLREGPRIRRLRFDRPEAGGYKGGGEFGRPDCPLARRSLGEGGLRTLIPPPEGRIGRGEPVSRRTIRPCGLEAAVTTLFQGRFGAVEQELFFGEQMGLFSDVPLPEGLLMTP
jgi:hypothetical protein